MESIESFLKNKKLVFVCVVALILLIISLSILKKTYTLNKQQKSVVTQLKKDQKEFNDTIKERKQVIKETKALRDEAVEAYEEVASTQASLEANRVKAEELELEGKKLTEKNLKASGDKLSLTPELMLEAISWATGQPANKADYKVADSYSETEGFVAGKEIDYYISSFETHQYITVASVSKEDKLNHVYVVDTASKKVMTDKKYESLLLGD